MLEELVSREIGVDGVNEAFAAMQRARSRTLITHSTRSPPTLTGCRCLDAYAPRWRPGRTHPACRRPVAASSCSRSPSRSSVSWASTRHR